MITDKIENIRLYKNIPEKVADFIINLTSETPCVRYELDEKTYVNIETYSTKSVFSAKYEYHKKFIDIQLLLSGEEKIYYKPVNDITKPQPFNEEKDIGFFDELIDYKTADFVKLDCSNFMLIFPHEAHAPQIESENTPIRVKKAVVKLPV